MRHDPGLTPSARFVRGWLSAAMATFLAASSHAAAGGSIPIIAVVVSLTAGALVCVTLAGRRLTLPRVVAGVAASQLAFHALFEMFGTTAGASHADGDVVGHHHSGPISLTPGMSETSNMDQMSVLMLVSHVIAGIASIVVIRHAEQLWWALLAILGATIAAILTFVHRTPVTDIRRLVFRSDDSPFLYDLLHCDTRLRLRGPPAIRLSFA